MAREYDTPLRDLLLAWLESDGPMTAAELEAVTRVPRKKISACINYTRSTYGTKYFRIASYMRQVGVGGREAPIYGVGPMRDAPRPRMNTAADKKAIQQRHREKYRALIRLKDRARKGKQHAHFLDILGVRVYHDKQYDA